MNGSSESGTMMGAGARDLFDREFTAERRKEAAAVKYRVRDLGDTRNPAPTARLIRQAAAADTPLLIWNDLESAVRMMALCAGNSISLDAPLDAQYLAAFQRIADFHGERLLGTPEETARATALIFADRTVCALLEAFVAWREGRAAG